MQRGGESQGAAQTSTFAAASRGWEIGTAGTSNSPLVPLPKPLTSAAHRCSPVSPEELIPL